MIYPELIAVDVVANDAEEAIQKVGAILLENGYVKESYIEAVTVREKAYPTGLQLKNLGIAMPHTDPSHVNKPAICIAKLAKPVTFSHMGMPDTKVEAQVLFMMAILDPKVQIDSLQKVLKTFRDEEAVQAVSNAKTKEELYLTAQKYLA